jgi:hypothetical protein
MATATTLNLSIDEDQIGDSERVHTTEQVGYVVFESAMVFPGAVQCQGPADCDDGLYCNGWEDCVGGVCVAGPAISCDDGISCTVDTCNEAIAACANVADDSVCDDGEFCNGTEICNTTQDCQAGTPPNANDGVGCTDDTCDEATDSIVSTPNNTNCDNSQFCDGVETCDAVNDCQAGSDPCPDQTCNEISDQCSGSPDPIAKLETGTMSVGGSYVTVPLVNGYVEPVVVCSVQYNNNTSPIVARVSNVTQTSFDVRLQNPSGGTVAAEDVSYIVVEKGVWTIDGVNIEAQMYLSTVTGAYSSWVGEVQSYEQNYTNPVVLGQVMSENDSDWSVFWCRGSSQSEPPSATSLRTGKTVCEDSDVTRNDETIGFIVFEAGHGTIGGVEFEAFVGADTVQGVSDNPPYAYTFNTSFASAPAVAVATLVGMDGPDGGWAQTHGPTMATATTLNLSIDEDQIGDSERVHTTEQVGYVVFESAMVFPEPN